MSYSVLLPGAGYISAQVLIDGFKKRLME